MELPLQGRQVDRPDRARGRRRQDRRAPNSRERRRAGVNISVAGGLPFGVAYLLDGAMHNDPQNNANLPLPFPDALQEFSVATSGLSAQNGMHSGASVNAVTKSGTNSFHGQRVRVPARPPVQRDQPVCGDRAGRQARDDGLQAQPVRRHAGRTDRAEQAVLLRRVTRARRRARRRPRTSPSCRRRRCWPATSRRSPRRRATAAARSRCARRS